MPGSPLQFAEKNTFRTAIPLLPSSRRCHGIETQIAGRTAP